MLNSRNFISTNPLCDTMGTRTGKAACKPSGLRLAGGYVLLQEGDIAVPFCMVRR